MYRIHYTQTSAPRVYKSSHCSSDVAAETDDTDVGIHARLGMCLSRSVLPADHPQQPRRTHGSQGRLGLSCLVPLTVLSWINVLDSGQLISVIEYVRLWSVPSRSKRNAVF